VKQTYRAVCRRRISDANGQCEKREPRQQFCFASSGPAQRRADNTKSDGQARLWTPNTSIPLQDGELNNYGTAFHRDEVQTTNNRFAFIEIENES
jgi:hypothetical protein